MAENNDRITIEKVAPGFERTIAQLDNLMVVVCDFTDGPMADPEKPHSHPHEQITYVAEGELYFFKGEKRHTLKKGDLITVPSNISHNIQTISTFVRLVDSFYPLRQEFIKQD